MNIYKITKREKCQSSFDQIRLYKAKCFSLNRKRHNFELLANIVVELGDPFILVHSFEDSFKIKTFFHY